jgi:hypothetical protein
MRTKRIRIPRGSRAEIQISYPNPERTEKLSWVYECGNRWRSLGLNRDGRCRQKAKETKSVTGVVAWCSDLGDEACRTSLGGAIG